MRGSTILNAERARNHARDGYWMDRTLCDSFDAHVRERPDKTLIVAGSKRLSYRDVAQMSNAVARSLLALGIGPGDVVSIQLPNWAEFVVIHLAVTRIGALTNPLLPVYRAQEIGHILRVARSKVVFIAASFRNFDYTNLYRGLRSGLPDLRHVVVIGDECPPDMTAFSALLELRDAVPVCLPAPAAVGGNEPTLLLFTSGTESTPKGVVHTHNTMLYGNRTVRGMLELTPEEVIWGVSPICHATGIQWCVRQAIVLGATVVMQDQFEVEAALDLIERERCTFTTAATPFAAMLLESPSLSRRDLSSFRVFFCGGAAIPTTLGSAMLDRIGCRLVPCWGMSECFAATSCSVNDPPERLWGTDGRALPGTEVAIFDDTRTRTLGAGEVGEIATRGPHVCLGYFEDSERTTASFSPEGWLFSNDLGTIDEAGSLRVVGRKKDIINRAGLKVSASEVEGLLLQHPDVLRVAIVAMPDTRLGEIGCAVIVPKEATPVSLASLVTFLKERGVANYKLPERLEIVSELPMTPTGKVQKFKLRELLARVK